MGFFAKIFGKSSNKSSNSKKEEDTKDDENCFEQYSGVDRIKVSLNEIVDNSSAASELRMKCFMLLGQGFSRIYIQNSVYIEMVEKEKQWEETKRITQRTAELNNQGIELEKIGKIDEAICVYEEVIQFCGIATHPYTRLMVLYKERGDTDNEIRTIENLIRAFTKENERRGLQCISDNPHLENEIKIGIEENKPIYSSDGRAVYNPYEISKYKRRLEKLKNNGVKPLAVYPLISKPYIPKYPTLGEQFEQTIKRLPEFNFYYNLAEDESTISYLNSHPELIDDGVYKKEIWKVQNAFKELLFDAKRYEDSKDFNSASELYEKIVGEQYFLTAPYDRLIKIYAKAKLFNDEIRVLKTAIIHFSKLKERQREYVVYLAKKYGKLDFATDRIANNKKISYFGGAFELYNSFPIIEEWEVRLKSKE